jgi:hypothetical protein
MRFLAKIGLALSVVVTLAFPVVMTASAQSGGPYTSGFQLQNLDPGTATVQIAFYQQSGVQQTSVSDSIAGNSSKTYFPLSAVSSGFNGSVVVSSDKPLAAITNVLKSDLHGGASYAGFTGGSTTVNMPLIMKLNAGSISTWFNVQNTGTGDAHVTIKYSGHTPACDQTATIHQAAAATFDQSGNSCLPSGYVGAATLTSSDQPVAIVVMQIVSGKESLLAYNGFSSSSTSPVMPLVSSNFYNSGTGIQIQNTGNTLTHVTLTYTPSSGFPGHTCTEAKDVAGNSSVTFGFPQLPAACGQTSGTGVTDGVNGGFVGSAKVTGNSTSQNLVAIVNQITRGTSSGDAYDAVNSAGATSKVSLPLLMDRNAGTLFTGFALTNVGASTTNVACTFSGSGHPANIASTSLASGRSLTTVQLGAGTAGWVGSGTCTATGGDAKIAAIVNEAATGTASTDDLLLTYPGVNY